MSPRASCGAPMPAPPIKGSFATPSLIAYVVNGKYSSSLPLYRMEQEFRCLGAAISRQNMANWVMRSWELWLSRLRARMRELLLEGGIVHADKTEMQVLREPGREARCKSRMWLFAAPACDHPIYVYEYNPTRSGKVAEDFLRGWSGWLVTDGYQPYFTLDNGGEVCSVACLVHIRRKFTEMVKLAGGDAKGRARAQWPSPPAAASTRCSPRIPGDLCQDFGHGSSRNQAAIGTGSDLGSVLSKKAAIASAGTL